MRKKLFSILALLLTVCGAWAQSNTEDTYIVAGNNTEIFGTAWDGSNESNTMAKGDDGKYRKEYNVNDAYNDVQLKVVKNESEWFGENDNNVEFNLTDAGTFTVVFDPETNGVSVTGEIVEEITGFGDYTVYAVGNGNDNDNWLNGAAWDPGYVENEMTEVSENVWQITYENVPEDFGRQVKFAINGTWAHNFGWPQNLEGDYELGEWFAAGYNGDNITFDTDDDCTVTLTLDLTDFNFNTKEGAKFKINIEYPTDQTDISAATVSGINASYDWTGNEIHPVPVVTIGGTTLTSSDYDVSYSDGCTNAGDYTITITGKGNYKGSKVVSFTINPGYFVAGIGGVWAINPNYQLFRTTELEKNEYWINDVVMSSSDAIKIVSSDDGATIKGYFGGNSDHQISANGSYKIYFRPNGNNDWGTDYYFYVEQLTTVNVTLAPTGYGTYYNSACDVTLPGGVAAYIVKGVTETAPTYEKIADGNGDGTDVKKTVPAGVAVLLYSASSPVTLELSTTITDSRTFTNLLYGSDVQTTTTGGVKYYKLTYGSIEGHTDYFGWFYGADGGAQFTSPAHKAWLALPNSASRGFLDLPDGDTTGIASIENKLQGTDNVWYDLNGRRIKAPTTKGIYIKDGRKLVIK